MDYKRYFIDFMDIILGLFGNFMIYLEIMMVKRIKI